MWSSRRAAVLGWALGLAACSSATEMRAPAPSVGGPAGTPLVALGEAARAAGRCDSPTAAREPLRRISRIEYDNAVRALFGVTTSPASAFVPEEKTGVTIGFDTNVGSTPSALAVEEYVTTAEQIAGDVLAHFSQVTGCGATTDAACITAFLVDRARRAFHGTLPGDEKTRLLADYAGTVQALDADQGLRFGVEAVLLSPRFLYLVEQGEGSGAVVKLTGSEVAGRLAAAIWRSVPDAPLLALADAGRLDDAGGVEAAARGMLSDGRAASMLEDFARQWLDVEAVPALTKDPARWPGFTPALARDLLGETEQLFVSIAANGGSLPDLFTADHTMASARVAAFYGLEGASGDGFVRLPLPPERRGVLTTAAVLAAHAHFDRPSIVERGKLVRVALLCDPVSPPPPSVDTTLPPPAAGKTERDLAAAHAAIPFCNGCHAKLDPIGYGFGLFDAAGKYTPHDGEDVAGTIAKPSLASVDDVSGPFHGAVDLSKKLAASRDAQQCYAIQAIRYAMSRNEAEGDACSVAAAWERFQGSGLGLEELIVAIAGSDTFRYRTAVVPGASCVN